jgi:3',5'-cyclic AMP phosphodiesterase CpdA
MTTPLTRRGFLGATAAALASTGLANAWGQNEPSPGGFRFVHLTDIHLQPELEADKGLARCLAEIEALDPKPDFILTGGDLVMDVFEQDPERSKLLFALYRKTLADHTGLPVRQCIGNHDVFGWANKNGVTPNHPDYGKKMVQEQLELPQTYYRFDHKGWRFFVLDDIQPTDDNRYQAYIDEPQWSWLETELARDAQKPAVVVCHIPILTVTVFGNATDDAYRIATSSMCRDVLKLVELFAKNNVRLALSGHIHQLDRIDYRGVTFICDGAVSGAWWKGAHKGFEEGFGILDVTADGALRHQYHDYGWHVG